MAHIPNPHLKLDLEHGEGTSTQNIPPDLAKSLPLITKLKPDNGTISYFHGLEATFVALSKNETKEERLHGKDWYNKDSPIEDQGKHASCWSTSGSENISEARHIHSVDIEYTPYSGAYLMDFCDPIKASNSHINSNGKHYCYGYSIFKGLQYAMRHGMPTHWNSIGCGSKHLPDRKLGQVRLRHVLNDVKIFSDVNKALDYLRIQPILGSMAIFNPDFKLIKGGIYRGPTTEKSVFSSWHTVSIRSITIEDGETIATVKNSHGLGSGRYGYIRVSMDVILLVLNTKGKPSFPSPGRLFRFFTFGEVRTDFEKEVVEWYVDGEKKDDQVTSSEYTTFLILEGVFNNTCGSVFEDENGENEVVGSPTDRAILKWAIQLQSKMNYRFSKFGSSIIKGSPLNSKPKCLGIVVNNQKKGEKSVRNHWKGSAAFILDKCTKYDSNGEYLEMSETKKTQLKDAINDMTARKLLCIAIAFKELRREDIQRQKKQREQWVLSCEDLVLLAIFGIKNPCLKYDDEKQASLDFEDEDEDEDVDEQDASKAYLADLADMDDSTICPSISEGLKNFPVWTIGAVDNSERKLNYDQVFVRDFVPNALAFLLNKEPEIVRNFILKTLRRQWEKKTDRFQHGEGVMPYSFKVFHEPVRNLETLIADFGETAIGRVAPVDSGFWWITLLRAAECQKSIRLILSMCLSEGFDIFPILLCADGSCLIDRRMGVYSYPIEIQALFFLALRCAALLLKQDGEGTEMVEQIVKKLHALSYHMRSCFWLDLKQLNEIYLYKTEEYSPSAVNKFNAIPEWIFNYKSPHGGLFIGNVSPTRIDFSWFALGNCIAMLSSLATPEQSSAIIDLIEARCEELVGEIPLKVSYPTIESDEWRIVTGCDPKNTRWSYPSGGSWRARRAIEVAEARLHKDRWPEYYVGKLGRYKQARKCQTWSIAGYLVPKMILDDGIIDTQFLGQCSGQAAGYVEEEILVAHGNGGFSICATSGKVDAMFEV